MPPIWKDVYEENEQLYARWESLKAKETLVNKSETICGDIDPNFLVAAGKHSIRYVRCRNLTSDLKTQSKLYL